MMAGNAVVPYEAGQVALIGSNLPHNWVSDIAPGSGFVGVMWCAMCVRKPCVC